MHYEQNAYPGIHSPPSYVALNSDARTACANVIHDIVYTTIPMAIPFYHSREEANQDEYILKRKARFERQFSEVES